MQDKQNGNPEKKLFLSRSIFVPVFRDLSESEYCEYSRAIRDIDASLDEELAERKPLMEEEIPDQLYEDILFGFRCEAEEP